MPETPGRGADAGIDLGVLVRILWSGRLWLTVATAAGAALAAGASLMATPTYDATVTLAVSASKFGDETSPVPSTANFRPFVESSTMIEEVLRAAGAHVSASEWVARGLLVEDVRTTNLLRVRARLDDAQRSARVANELAARAVENAKAFSQQEAVEVRDLIGVQLEEARQRLDDGQQALRRFRDEAQIELLRKDVEAKLGERANLLKLQVRVESERARLEAAERERAARQPTKVLTRSIDTDNLAAEALRSQGADGRQLLDVKISSEFSNTVYDSVDERVAESRTTLAALEKERRELVDVRRMSQPKLPELTTLYDREVTLARLELEVELARRNYLDTASKYDGARLRVASRSSQLQIVDPAVVPTTANPRNVTRNAVMGAAAALALALVGVVAAAAAQGRL